MIDIILHYLGPVVLAIPLVLLAQMRLYVHLVLLIILLLLTIPANVLEIASTVFQIKLTV